jgi:hypothetical protein
MLLESLAASWLAGRFPRDPEASGGKTAFTDTLDDVSFPGRSEPVEAHDRTGQQHKREPPTAIPVPPYLQAPEATQPR